MTDSVDSSAIPWRTRAKHLTSTILDFILPPTCANCGKVGTLLCAGCQSLMPRVKDPVCTCCGRELDGPGSNCHVCQWQSIPLKQIRSLFLFHDPVPHIIHQMKYNGLFALAGMLGNLMAEAWPYWQNPIDLVIPIPLHPQRVKSRGYNQSQMLARQISELRNIPCPGEVLQRIRHTRPQVDLNVSDRLANVAGAFLADNSKVEGKNVLLIDDVFTSGSTMSEAARALLKSGAMSVSGYCLAQAARF